MKKVSVITRHAITNYGSLLQSLATQKMIEKMGYECEIVNYIRDDESYSKHELTLLKKKPNWYNNPVKRMTYLLLRQPESILAGRKFEKVRNETLNLSKLYTTKKELHNNPPKADVYMTGSDQVWGPVENGSYDSSYCLSFAPKSSKKISYAASFGHTDMTEKLSKYFQKYLDEYNHISVREESAAEIIKELGYEVKQVLDPTLLMNAKEWDEYVGKKINGRYVLVYQLHNDKSLGEYAKKVAKAKGIPLIRVSVSMHQINRRLIIR